MNDPKEGESRTAYEFRINFHTYDSLSEGERLGLQEIIRQEMRKLESVLDDSFPGKSFHLTQSHGDSGE